MQGQHQRQARSRSIHLENRSNHIWRKVILIFGIFFTLLLSSRMIALGQNRTDSQSIRYKYYTSIQVQAGDTLWEIAQNYMSEEFDGIQAYIEEVKKMNQLSDDKIHAGEYLMMPYYSADLR